MRFIYMYLFRVKVIGLISVKLYKIENIIYKFYKLILQFQQQLQLGLLHPRACMDLLQCHPSQWFWIKQFVH